ncbi:MAG TPA: hypothetical protein VF355_00345 [Anaerolineaceae bacterium]
MPESQQDTSGTTMCIGCIDQWVQAGYIDLNAYAGHGDLTVGSGRSGLCVRDRRIDLYDSAGSTTRGHYKYYDN